MMRNPGARVAIALVSLWGSFPVTDHQIKVRQTVAFVVASIPDCNSGCIPAFQQPHIPLVCYCIVEHCGVTPPKFIVLQCWSQACCTYCDLFRCTVVQIQADDAAQILTQCIALEVEGFGEWWWCPSLHLAAFVSPGNILPWQCLPPLPWICTFPPYFLNWKVPLSTYFGYRWLEILKQHTLPFS